MLDTDSTIQFYADLNGNPLQGGSVFLGVAGQNPVTSPITVYWDAAATQPAKQPISVKNGLTTRNGSPARVYIPSDYSKLVQDSKGRQVSFDASIPAPIRSALAGGTGGSLVGFQQPAAGAKLRDLASKSSERVTADDFAGVAPDGVTDCAAGVQKAIDYLFGLGGGVVQFGPGTYGLGSGVKLRPGVFLVGQGNATVLRVLVDNIEAISRHSDAAGKSAGIANMAVEGYGDRNASLGLQKLINVAGFDALFISNVETRYSRNMSITGVATAILVENCRVYKSFRDGINVTGSNYMRVVNNDIRECGDDAIACHISSSTLAAFDSAIVITGNIIRKSFGIKVLGARNATISGNDLRFWYGYGIDLALDGASLEGEGAKYAIAVTGNSFVDGMNSTRVGAGTQAAAVFINGNRSLGSGGDAIPVLPGDYSVTTGAFVLPGVYENTNGPTKPRASDSSIVVTGNTFKQTIEGVAKFSDAGFGSLWNNTGVIDPAMTSLIRDVLGIQLGTSCDIRALSVTGNTFSGMSRAFFAVGVMKVFTDLVFSGNSVSRATDGIAVDGTASGGLNIRGTITGNLFDIDPYCEHALRTTPIDGSWTATDGSNGFGVSMISASGFAITGNVFTNCVRGVKLSGSVSVIRGNTLVFDWSGASLKGVASINGVPVSSNSHVFADCNPTSATFGQMTAAADSGNASEAAAMPTAGYYRIGQVVANSAPVISAGKVLAGWRRLTNGNAHVLNTDWAGIFEPNS